MAAPAYPPSRACDELVGNPNHQVSRSHVIAPISPAKITYGVTYLRSIIPVPTVLATPVPMTKAATKLKPPAQITAWAGVSTRGATIAALEVAAAWKH